MLNLTNFLNRSRYGAKGDLGVAPFSLFCSLCSLSPLFVLGSALAIEYCFFVTFLSEKFHNQAFIVKASLSGPHQSIQASSAAEH